jgi:tRNA A-37 threonylcarbamoyl transferase component Bud32
VSPTAPLDLSLTRDIADALGEAPVRVRMLETPAGRLWLKRVEHLPLRWRLQKGNGRRSFEKDREGLHVLGGAGLPVAPIVAEGPDYFVTPDLGVTLRTLMSDACASDDHSAAFRAAGRALAALHAQGFSHGRPAVRDLCWDGAEVRFIDMERFSPRHQSPRHFAADIFVFVHSVFAAGGGEADLENALTAYRNAGGPLQASITLARRLRWIGPVARRLQRLKPHSRDLTALEPTLAYIASAR